ncbi:hypothetical protein CYMTET_22209 [Cymbomonas tetramitiformis]|uniref:Uncharacterized protein n=1 Tax=Cymbomonas tetramitiformis TaxID=36881 RepID=A0AAE0G1S2_9CHLO|nr:hypothetical protein CYMTET_22209 [Cymbomonas tetramitiformis]|eukprot:gene1056-1601_t
MSRMFERDFVVRGHVIGQRALHDDDPERYAYDIVECDDCSSCVCLRAANAKRSKRPSQDARVLTNVVGPWMPFATVVAHVSLLCRAVDDDPNNGLGVVKICDVRIPENIILFSRDENENRTCFLSCLRVELERTCSSNLDWPRVIQNLTRNYVVDRRGTITHADMSHATSFLAFLRKRLSERTDRTKKRPSVFAEEELAKAMIRNLRQRVRWLPVRLQKRQYVSFALEHDRHKADRLAGLYTTNTFRTFLSSDDFMRYVGRVQYAQRPVPEFEETLVYDDEDVRTALGVDENAISRDATRRWERLIVTREVRIETSVTRYGPSVPLNVRARDRAHTEYFPLSPSKIDRVAEALRATRLDMRRDPTSIQSPQCRLVLDARNPLIRAHVYAPVALDASSNAQQVHILATTAWTDDATFTACADIIERVFHSSIALVIHIHAWDNETLVHGELDVSKRNLSATKRLLKTAWANHLVESPPRELDAVVAFASTVSLKLRVEPARPDDFSPSTSTKCDKPQAWLNQRRVHVTNAAISDESCELDRFVVGEWASNAKLGIAGRVRGIRDAHTGERLCAHERRYPEDSLSRHARVMLLEVLWNEDTLQKEMDMYVSLSDAQWRACRACPCICAHQLPASCEWTEVACHLQGCERIEDTSRSMLQTWGWLPVCAQLLRRCHEAFECDASGDDSTNSSPTLTLTYDERRGERKEDATLFFLNARADVAYANLHDKSIDSA